MKIVFIAGIAFLLGIIAGRVITAKSFIKQLHTSQFMAEKHLRLYLLAIDWIRVIQEGKSLASHLEAQGYRSVAIYGMSFIGERLVDELISSNLKIAYAVDKNAPAISSAVDVLLPKEELPNVDAVIVTSITYFEDIKNFLIKKGFKGTIIAIDDLLQEL